MSLRFPVRASRHVTHIKQRVLRIDLLLHIGTPKTGTTALQYALGDNAGLLSERGVLFPMDTGRNHIRLVLCAARPGLAGSIARRLDIAPEDIEAEAEAFLAGLEAGMERHDRCVLSSEFLYEMFREEELIRLRDALRRVFPTIRIAVYLRPQDSMFASEVSQRIKAGATQPDRFLQYDPGRYDYLGRLRKWAEVFGHDAIHAVPFETARAHPRGTAGDFFERFSLPATVTRAKQVNPSLDATKLVVLRRITLAVQDHARAAEIRRAAIAALEKLPALGPGWQPSAAQHAEIAGHVTADNATLSEVFLGGAAFALSAPSEAPDIDWDGAPALEPEARARLRHALERAFGRAGLTGDEIAAVLADVLETAGQGPRPGRGRAGKSMTAMDQPKVFGLLGDRGWIIERLARDIAAACPNFRYGTRIEGRPDIVYYMTYSARRQPFDGIEVGYFTHVEEGLPAEQRFYDIAAEVDHCVTQATRYEDILRARGIEAVTTIPPGIDHDEFFPRLRVGIVGRTYHTGRKGEALVARLMDMTEVSFLFTGDGWPGPPVHVPQGEMGEFYRSLDYVLVPSLYEGGPMCVPEAIACGTPVIAPDDIGWVRDFPHISFPKGDVEALRAVLKQLARDKIALSAAAADYTARNWGLAHGALFRKLWQERKGAGPVSAGAAASPSRGLSAASVVQVMHGGERHSKGGPTVRIPHTAERMAAHCGHSWLHFGPLPEGERPDIAHFYNIWQPPTALALHKALGRTGARRVFSPILLDLSQRPVWEAGVMAALSRQGAGPETFAAIAPGLQRMLERGQEDRALARRGYQPTPGFAAKLAEILGQVDLTVFLSRFEQALAADLGACPRRAEILHNPVDCRFFAPLPAGEDTGTEAETALSARMQDLIGLDPGTPFLLSVGRIEVRKNQLAVAEIARRAELPLVIAGHEGARAYADAVRAVAGDRLRAIGRVEPHSPELRWLYRNCAAFVSLSWAEGASLSALEAAATGAPLLLSDTSSEREYFDGMATFCGPLDVEEALDALPGVMAAGDPDARAARHAACASRFDWEHHVTRLAELYEKLLASDTRS